MPKIPDYQLNAATGRGFATFELDRSVLFGPFADAQSIATYNHTLAAWLANGRRFPSADEDCEDMSSWRPARFRPVPIKRLRDELLVFYQPPLRARRTLWGMEHCFKVLETLEVKISFDLTEELVAKLVATRPPELSCRTTAELLRNLRIIAKFAVRRGYLRESPFAFRSVGACVRITPPTSKRHYTAEEVRALLSTMAADIASPTATAWEVWKSRRLYAVASCCAYGAFRAGEAFRLHAEDIDLEHSIITVVPRERLKTAGAARMVPMPPRLREILANEWMPFRQSAPDGYLDAAGLACPYAFPGVTRKSYWRDGPADHKPLARLKVIAYRAGLADFGDATFARFRHAWACQAEFLGIPGAGIMRVMGHTTEQTSIQNYRHSIAKNLRATVEGFDY